MTKTIIAGSRDTSKEIFDLVWCLIVQCAENFKTTEVVSGHAIGVDRFGELVAKEALHVPIMIFLPDYDKYGRQAPLRRNTQMAIYADNLIAIWDGKSRGTKHMIDQMRFRNKPVEIIEV